LPEKVTLNPERGKIGEGEKANLKGRQISKEGEKKENGNGVDCKLTVQWRPRI